MGLVFHLICLFFTLFVLQSYVSSGFHAREHRLLPLVLGLIALNSFYRITYYVTGEAQTLRILTDLLAIHMLYLMIHYVGDFMKFQLKLRTEVILFCSLVLFNSMLIIRAAQRETYQDAFRIALLCYTGILLGLATYVRVKSEVSVWEGHVNDMLYLGMALPGVAMLFRAVTPKAEEFLVPGAFEISCLIVFYLMMTGRLSNVTNIIRENFYNISDIPTFLFDNRMRYRDANASARRWFPEIVGELTDDPQEYPFYTKMMRWSKDPDQDYVVQWKESYCRCQLHPVCSENVVRGYILTLLDITQQKKETVLMEDLKKKAEEQSFLKSRFLASVSHDLRSPLHAIIGGSDILKRQNLPDESKNILEYICIAGNNLLEQVDTILAYSKLEAGMLTLKDKTYNFYEMIEEQARLCLLNIREKDIVFTVRFLDRFPEQVSGDYLRVAQIFQNILSNACKFTEQGTITLSLHCKMEEGQVWFDGCVEDTGVGMNAQQLEHIFGEYVSYSDDRGLEGSGLGLSLVKQMVDLMHGHIHASSEEGVGTRIMFAFEQEQTSSVMLPPTNIDRDTLLKKPVYAVSDVKPNWVFPGARVLLVDDMEVNRLIFKKLVGPWKLTVDLAASGDEAIAAAKLHKYQMIILDQMMPEKSGIETADEISEFCDVPLVLMTADISDATRTEALIHGFIEFLPKPVQMENLGTLLETCLPVEYREIPTADTSVDLQARDREEALAYARTLETYCKEVQELLGTLEEYEKTNLDMFRVKVHGIKGISRQIGQDEMGEQAEIMEMAAKTENHVFIRRNLPKFLTQLQGVHDDVEREFKELRAQYEDKGKENEKQEIGQNEKLQLWKDLKDAFDAYDLNAMEEMIGKLSEVALLPEEEKILQNAKEACDDFEYEDGSAACEEAMSILA